ncbi:uncharacterized protein LOC129742532 [Uranotaenia lowii]|uniref:uncharacterized protein LOC129742532 n=1 Tax=Uranotaenia lowii TaxID=190385 RepID=UPI002479F91C|nr:uncharacterized protein LOC129742532 [Uranotaenia lowii]
MGSKLSPLLAEVFMADFETDLEKREKLFPRVWWRYVDDIFASVKERYLPQTLELLNNQHRSIKFTVEEVVEGKLPFLDLLISRNEDNTIKFEIYWKPTSTDRYITVDSRHFGAQKQAASHSIAHRLYHIPLEKPEFEDEKQKIFDAGIVNGNDNDFVLKILHKHARKKHRSDATTLTPDKEESQRVSLPFYPKLTNGISQILLQHGLKTAYKSGNTLKDRLVSLNDKIPEEDRSGIYEIPCSSCPAIYIGQTRRKFKVRLKEHKNAVENGRINESSVAAHRTEFDHSVDWKKVKFRKSVRKTSHLNAWESIFISTAEKPLMNEDEPPIISSLFNLINQKSA